MAPRKPPLPQWLRENRLGCYIMVAVLIAFIAAATYIGLASPAENALNAVIPTLR